MKPYDISFVIIEYHSIEDISNCIGSINEKCRDLSYEIIVSSNSIYPLEKQNTILKEFPEIKWIFNKDNLGFAKAMNIGILNSSGRGVVTINPDVTIQNGSISSAYQYLMSEPNIGLIGPKIIDSQAHIQDSCRSFMTPKRLILRNIRRLFYKQDVLLRQNFSYNEMQPVDWVVGAFMLAKREAINKVGLLDEKYFLYIEDMDWCKRFWDCGYKVVYYPKLVVEYKGDKKSTSPIVSRRWLNKYTFYHLKSYLRFLKKHGMSVRRKSKDAGA